MKSGNTSLFFPAIIVKAFMVTAIFLTSLPNADGFRLRNFHLLRNKTYLARTGLFSTCSGFRKFVLLLFSLKKSDRSTICFIWSRNDYETFERRFGVS